MKESNIMDTFTLKTALLGLIYLSGCVLCQETHAEGKGTAVVEVSEIQLEDFLDRQDDWRETVAWYTSHYCKLGEDNCWTTDKQIRRYDVVIQSVNVVMTHVHVTFHIRDRFDHDRAGLEMHQTRRAFEKYDADMEALFGKEMSVISPEDDGMEPWMIAVITVCCVVGVALIITVAVLGAKSCRERQRREMHEELIKERVKEEYMNFSKVVDDKDNPGYSTDTDTHPSSSKSSSHQPPPYNNVTGDPESLLDEVTSGEYNVSDAWAGMNRFPDTPQEDLIEITKI